MLNILKHAVPLRVFAVVSVLAVASVTIAAIPRLALSGQGVQRGATIVGLKTTPRRAPTHSMGALRVENVTLRRLVGPAMHESGMGRLVGAVTLGDQKTPRRAPTLSVSPQ
jgi:hypothetical protein